MNYQKVYMNQIHSSSLLGQLAQMWRSQLVCDAYIRTGTVTTKAHRVVLLAACPMLQSMEKASIGSHLEVRLTADIKQEAVNMFLQYLYEGFMLLTEENCKDVEKVARLLQVDSVIKCCADFYKCLESKTGNNMYSNSKYKYSSYDMLEFRHVRATDLQKTVQDRLMKRASEMGRPLSPSSKKQRLYRASTPPSESSQSSFSQRADDTFSMSHSYGSGQQEPWDRVPRPGANAASMSRGQSQRFQQPSVIDIVEDSIELIHVDPGDGSSHQPPSQKGVAVSVASQLDSGPPNISIVSVTGNTGPPHGPSPSQGHSQRQTSGPSYSSPHVPSSSSYTPRHSSVSSSPSQSKASDRAIISLTDPQISQITREVTHQLQQQEHSASSSRPPALQLAPGLTSPHESLSQQRPPHFPFTERLQQTASKPSFAAGSARQVGAPQMPNLHSGSSSTGSPSTLRPDRSPSLSGRSDSMDRPPSVEASKDSSKQKNEDSSTASSADLMADITIIKVETGDETMSKEHKDSGQPGHSSDGVIHSTDHSGLLSGDTTGGLDMHVDAPDDGGTMTMQIQRNDDGMGQEGDSDIEELEATGDWPHDSNDDSSLSNDPNNPLGGFRGTKRQRRPLDSEQSKMEADMDKQNSLATAEGDANTMKSGYPISSGERFTLNLPNMARPPPPFPILPNITRPPPPYPLSLESSPNFMEFQSRPRYLQSPSSIAHGKPDPVVAPDSAGSSAPVVVKKKAIVLKGIDDLPGHKIVPNDIKNGARCTYCKVHRIKTPSGWRVKTNYKCETCDVALCASEVCERNCFHLHHVEMFGEQILGDKTQ